MSRKFPIGILCFAILLETLICAAVLAQLTYVSGETRNEQRPQSGFVVPPGTILPVRLNSTLSSAKSKVGQAITGRIMQDVPITPGVSIRAGSKVVGHIVEVTPACAGHGVRLSLQFDKLVFSRQTIPIVTNLRAIAGFMQVLEAQTPPIGAGETDVYRWLTTVQIGGDVVYGEGGVVTAADNPNQVVGREVNGGVLGQVRAKAGTECRGAVEGSDRPQALWVFSTDACGTYGLEHIGIAHAGRTDPLGVIVLTSDGDGLKVSAGAGMLLRVNAIPKSPDDSVLKDIDIKAVRKTDSLSGGAVIDSGKFVGRPGSGQSLRRQTYAGL